MNSADSHPVDPLPADPRPDHAPREHAPVDHAPSDDGSEAVRRAADSVIGGDPECRTDPAYRQLWGQLAARYSLETIAVNFDDERFYLTRVSNPGDVPLDLDEHGELRWQPYWADDWESSRAICRVLLRLPIEGCSVLDLGCGLGLTGAVAASRGATVVLADNAAPALEFSRLNCWKWRERVRLEIVDWKAESTSLPRFDWIVGAEIIYDSDDWPDLDRFWRSHLATGGRVLLCDPFRRTGREFRDWVVQRGWTADFSRLLIPEFEGPVNLIELRLPPE